MRRMIVRNYKNKLSVLTVIFIFLFANQGCQTQSKKDNHLNDVSRTHHAKILLKHDYAKSIAKEFEKDARFGQYLERYIAKENSKLNAEELSESLLKASRDHFYDPVFLLAVVKTESQFNPFAKGTHGEIGLMQIKPVTAEWICEKKKIKWLGAAALNDPSYNVLVGSLYFAYLKKSFKTQNAHYINAYNLGLHNLQRLPASERLKHPYYDKVLNNYLTIYKELKKIRNTI